MKSIAYYFTIYSGIHKMVLPLLGMERTQLRKDILHNESVILPSYLYSISERSAT